jgi:hypothetical protein
MTREQGIARLGPGRLHEGVRNDRGLAPGGLSGGTNALAERLRREVRVLVDDERVEGFGNGALSRDRVGNRSTRLLSVHVDLRQGVLDPCFGRVEGSLPSGLLCRALEVVSDETSGRGSGSEKHRHERQDRSQGIAVVFEGP